MLLRLDAYFLLADFAAYIDTQAGDRAGIYASALLDEEGDFQCRADRPLLQRSHDPRIRPRHLATQLAETPLPGIFITGIPCYISSIYG